MSRDASEEKSVDGSRPARSKFLAALSLSTPALSQPEMSRSMSAPPAEFLSSIHNLIDEADDGVHGEGRDETGGSILNDPGYAAYFYSNSRLDPRLPPPSFYSPGQSWRMWPSGGAPTGTSAIGSLRQRTGVFGPNSAGAVSRESSETAAAAAAAAAADDYANMQRKKLVDMIQEDFPRTPSPVYTLQQQPGLGPQSLPPTKKLEDVRVKGLPPKGFTISGSAEGVLAAAALASAHDDADLDFAMEKLQLLEEDEPASVRPEEGMWSGRGGFPRSPVSDGDYIEPFALAHGASVSTTAPAGRPSLVVKPAAVAPFALARSAPQGHINGGSHSVHGGSHSVHGGSHSVHGGSHSVHGGSHSVHGGSHSVHGSRSGLQHGQLSGAAAPFYETTTDRATILEDFRANRHKKYELADLKGLIIEFSTDQHGSRFIQQKLETASDADKELVFVEIYPMALQLMTDVFGNYVIQKFFEFGTTSQKVALGQLMQGHVLTLSLQMYGCRVVQKALEHVPPGEQGRLVQELEGHVLRCVKDQNGNHVIQKCIECVPLSTNAPFLTASFLSQASQLAMHPYGCRVIQRIFEHGPPEQTRALLDELLRYTGQLIQDQYGNYVIQHVLERGKPADRTHIIDFLRGRVLEFSRHKFASNVVEKCVSFGTVGQRQQLIEEVLTPVSVLVANGYGQPEGDVAGGEMVVPLHLMTRDQFANYVVQKMLDVVDGAQRELLLASIKPQLPLLRKYTYGKHILNKVEKMLGIATSDVLGETRGHYSAPATPGGVSVSFSGMASPTSVIATLMGDRNGAVVMPRSSAIPPLTAPAATLGNPYDFPPLGTSLPKTKRR